MNKYDYMALTESKYLLYASKDDNGQFAGHGIVTDYETPKPTTKSLVGRTAIGSLGGAALMGGATAAYGHHKYKKAQKAGASKEELAKIKAKYRKRAAMAAGVGAGVGGAAGFSNAKNHAEKHYMQRGYDVLSKNDPEGMSKSQYVAVYDTSMPEEKQITRLRRVKNGKVK